MASSIQSIRVKAEETTKSMETIEDNFEEELFEINLDEFNHIQSSNYYDYQSTTTAKALLANCLVPIKYISDAIPYCGEESRQHYFSKSLKVDINNTISKTTTRV